MFMNKIIIAIFCLFASTLLFAQQNQTLYFMHKIPQSNLLNPAIQNECKIYLSGMLLPIAGQVLPPLHFNYNNNGFAINQLIRPGTGAQADSFIFDFPYLLGKLRTINYLSVEADINWLSAGYRWKTWYFTFNLTEKLDIQASFPKDLITLAWEGNGKSLLGEKSFLSFFGAGINWYREYAIGASKTYGSKWTFGARGKLLFGKENIWCKNHYLSWETNEEDYAYTVKADWEVYSSQQFYNITKLQMDYVNDSMMFEMDTILNLDEMTGKDVKRIIMEHRNPGTAIDLGFKFVLNNKLNFYGSLLDIGFIHYKNNVNAVKASGEFYFDGINIQPAMVSKDDSLWRAYLDQLKDSVIKIFEPKLVKKAYNYWLAPKLCLGGTYTLNDKINFGVLWRGDIFLRRLHSGVTLSANANLKKWFMGTISYTVENNSFKQVGAGVLFKIPWVQFYVVTDNVCGFIWPQATRNINFRLGINLLFGCDKKQSSTMVDTKFM